MRRTPLRLLAGVGFLALGGCLEGNLPSVVSRSSADAATQAPLPTRAAVGDVEDGSLANNLEVADASQPSVSESGEIRLTMGLPIDTATGQVASLGSLTVRLWLDGRAPRALTLELNHPSGAVNLNLDDIAAGGPYVLDVTATSAGGVACAGSSPPFFVSATQTVWVLESLICGVDAGLASTLYLDPP
ncbi:MAG TPA: hypothetical protein VLC06_00645 [Polyangia bacterium]|nr:hypothetical protein [Polyangia bacterium]